MLRGELVSIHEHHCQCHLKEYVQAVGLEFCPCATMRVFTSDHYRRVRDILIDIASLETVDEKLNVFCKLVTEDEELANA